VNKTFVIIYSFLLAGSIHATAQKLQFGAKATVAGNIVLPVAGGFDNSHYKLVPGITTGIGAVGNFYLGKKFRFNICSGIQLQVKTYSFRLYNLDIPNVTGMVSYRPLFISPEIPLLICFEKKRKKKDDHYINYQLGAVFAYNIPFMVTCRQQGPFLNNNENDTLISQFDVTSNNLKTFSPDIYAGISWVKKNKKRRVSEWGISLQYAIKNSASYHFIGSVSTSRDWKVYNAFFTAKLSYIAIHYIIYPKRWMAL
jgi:hypothetical protein